MRKTLNKLVMAFLVFCFLLSGPLLAQDPAVDLQLELHPELSSSEIVELSQIATGERAPGSRLLMVRIQNNENERIDDLYLDLEFSAGQGNIIWKTSLRSGFPFSLRAGQSVSASNDDIARGKLRGLPGNVTLEFNREVTENGRNLLADLRNQTGSPPGEYTLEVGVYKHDSRERGGQMIVNAVRTVELGEPAGPGGGRGVGRGGPPSTSGGDFAIELVAPGDYVETRPPVNIFNAFPEFRWEGSPGETYRVVIVERQPRQSPESLIQSALDTPPGSVGESVRLLDFEQADFLVDGTSFQYPSTGVQSLRTGRQYLWQVFAANDLNEASELWSFRLTGSEGAAGRSGEAPGRSMQMEDEEVREILVALLGMNTVRELERGNYDLLDIELENRQYSGEMALEELYRLIEKLNEGTAKINEVRIDR